ncbi:MAG: intein-containing adenosylcobalamin-dependent ribonucleoside-diphosphate reductase, partial [Deltaproteobacteria bacterium]|nr:intein-containing adenosylcobalamin-dependent ribonucleoside-diphosphate reductase [Deltaproteobacteria bacterium]
TNLSTLRSSREKLSSGGRPSGPVSFMRGYDAFAGVIKSGGKCRRSAVLRALDVEHPDIVEFIDCKVEEEKKAWALIDAGYDGGINGDAYGTVAFQNANNSVRITDEFMNGAFHDWKYETKAVLDGQPIEELKARDVLRRIAEATHICGDPGVQFHDTINRWHTCKASGEIRASNPCFTGNMRLLTVDGYRSFEYLAKQRGVLIYNHQGEVSESRVWSTGVKNIVKINFFWKLNMEPITCTPDHLFMLNNGSSKQAQDLSRGDRLMPYVKSKKEFDLDLFLAGFVQGDGNTGRIESGPHKGLEVFIGTKDIEIAEMYGWKVKDKSVYSNYAYNIARKYGLSAAILPERSLPELPVEDRADFLSGLFSANGSVINKTRVALKTTCKELAQKLVVWLDEIGIKAYITTNLPSKVEFSNGVYECRESYDVNIHKYRSILVFAEKIAFKQQYKVEALQSLLVHRAPCVESIKPSGRERVYDFTEPKTHWGVVENLVAHNCSEIVFIDDSACNLASLNLLKFLRDDGKIDIPRFLHVVDIMITAQDILIDNASYPTEKIATRSRAFRPVGLGFTNLGALLMAKGLPYDSDKARQWAAAITALMTGVAYAQSARIASVLGAFVEYDKNAESMKDVIDNHIQALYEHKHEFDLFPLIHDAKKIWPSPRDTTRFRNAQVTALAPNGTTSFMMDCDTTGIEPAMALVSYKQLVDGGTVKMVNRSVEAGLRRLGYDDKEVAAIVAYVEEHGSIEGAPGIRHEHLPVFDCALAAASGGRTIEPMGHIKMMAAVQPFVSGAISKTVNVPNETTVDEIYDIYMEAWQLGLKSISVYRDGSKRTQPLSTKPASRVSGGSPVLCERRRLPDERRSITHKFDVSGHKG